MPAKAGIHALHLSHDHLADATALKSAIAALDTPP
jgi:hypothetical protein